MSKPGPSSFQQLSRTRLRSRREVLRFGLGAVGSLMAGRVLIGCGGDSSDTEVPAGKVSNIANLGPLGAADANGVRLPAGFQARIVARSNAAPIAGREFLWHPAPDGGATFATADGGWIYVSNSEWPLPPQNGGVGALRFDAAGNLVDAYRILDGSVLNCAGGPTPWGTWLSCEEFDTGRVWECNPLGGTAGIVRPALGVFQHEAVAVDPMRNQLYLTEDRGDGRFYRFTPDRLTGDGHADLSSGTLAVARIVDGNSGLVTWLRVPSPIPEPAAGDPPTRHQVPESTAFDGGEGIWFHQDVIYFTTKGDGRVWAYDAKAEIIRIFYDDSNFAEPVLTGVDNVVVSKGGDVLVAEDGGDMQIVAITQDGRILPIVQVEGQRQSEITGPAFDPSGSRLYFSSQRGAPGINPLKGITYEVTGPFFV